jgi:hypothetical protein
LCKQYQHRCSAKHVGTCSSKFKACYASSKLTDPNLPENAPSTDGICNVQESRCVCPTAMHISTCGKRLNTGHVKGGNLAYKSILTEEAWPSAVT